MTTAVPAGITPERITPEQVATIASTSRHLSSGASRIVFDLGTHVLKLNTSRRHWAGGCAEEIATWESADEAMRAFLCPIVAADPDGQWLVMPKCAPAFLDYGDSDQLDFERNMAYFGIGDQHPGNIMLLTDDDGNERLVSVDYAMAESGGGRDDSYCCCADCRVERGSISPRRETPENWRTYWTLWSGDVQCFDDRRERAARPPAASGPGFQFVTN